MKQKISSHLPEDKNAKLLTKVGILFIAYFLSARFGLSLDAVNNFATLIWFASGISLAALLLFGYEIWPGIFLGAFLANLLNGASPIVAIGIGIGNTLEAVAGAYLLRRAGFHLSLDRVKDVLFLVLLVGPAASTISATIGVFALAAGGSIPLSTAYITWEAWWTGDVMSFVVIAPLILTWSGGFHKLPKEKVVELLLLLALTLGLSLAIFRGLFIGMNKNPITFILYPSLVWASLRFRQRVTVSIVFLISIVAVLATIQGIGPFVEGDIPHRLLFVNSFMATIAITSMILAAVETERRELEERKDEFISLASHELKTPLTSMKVFTQLLLRMPIAAEKQTKHYLTKINTQIDKLTFHINDLLDVSRIQSGKLDFHREHFSMLPLLATAAETIQATAATHEIIFDRPRGRHTYMVYADKERINQVIINLLNNAIRYSPKNRKIILSLSIKKGNVITDVKDFGPGIAPQYREKIFQRYYRITEGPLQAPGLGIGLYISSEIIKQSGGALWVKSKLKKGSTFSFSLPLAKHRRGREQSPVQKNSIK